MAKRAHQAEQPEGDENWDEPEPGGGQHGGEAGEHPQPIIHAPNQAFEAAAAAAGAIPGAGAAAGLPGGAQAAPQQPEQPEQQQELINFDNIIIDDDDK